jgi:hypothetical protein
MSKTFLDALTGVLISILEESLSTIFLGGDGFRQGKHILLEAGRIISNELRGQDERNFVRNMIDRPLSKSPILKEPDVWSIKFKNKSMIRTAPIGDGNQIRGYRAHVVIKDERKDMPTDVDEKVVRPFAILDRDVTSESQEFVNLNIDSGTLEYEEDDYTKLTENYQRLMEGGNPNYLFVRFEYIDAFREDPNGKFNSKFHKKRYEFWKTPYAIKMDKIEEALDDGTMDEESWNAEYRCLPKRATGNIFSYYDVRDITNFELMSDEDEVQHLKKLGLGDRAIDLRHLHPQIECEDPVIIGVDVARESANTAFVVIRLGPVAKGEWDIVSQTGKTPFSNVIFAYQERNMPYLQAAQYIYDLMERYPNTLLVAMDKRGGGSGVRDDLFNLATKIGRPTLYDPQDNEDGGVARKVDKGLSDPRLFLIKYTDEDITMALNRVKAGVQKKKLLLVYPFKGETSEERLAYKHINEIGNEMRVIHTKPTANWLKIIIEDGSANTDATRSIRTKDLWTGLMYAYNEGFIRFIHKEVRQKKVLNQVATLQISEPPPAY